MVSSSADIVLQNRQISQSETSTINICDVNTMASQHARVSGYQNVTSSVFCQVIVRLPRHLDVSQRTNHGMRSDANELFCCRQIMRVVRLMACNYERCVFVTIFFG